MSEVTLKGFVHLVVELPGKVERAPREAVAFQASGLGFRVLDLELPLRVLSELNLIEASKFHKTYFELFSARYR